MNELTTLRQRVIDCNSCIERRENVMAEMRGDLVDAKNAEVVAWGKLDSVQAENEKLLEEIANLEDRVISQGQMLREIVNITKGSPVDKMHSTHDAVASVARLKARVAELRLLAERLQHCAKGFYVDQGDYGHMEAIMQDYHAIMRADSSGGDV